MNLQFCSSPHILLFSLFIPGDIDVSVMPGVWCCVSYPHVTPWGMFVEAIGETVVIHMYQFISLSIICACTHVATHRRTYATYNNKHVYRYSSSVTHLSFSWSGFKFLLPVKMYYWGMATSEAALTSVSCDVMVGLFYTC